MNQDDSVTGEVWKGVEAKIISDYGNWGENFYWKNLLSISGNLIMGVFMWV